MADLEAQKRRKRLIKAKQLLLAKKDINYFIEYCFTDEKGVPVKQEPFHRAWQAHFDKHKYAGIIGPRGHGKSQQMVVFRTIFHLGHNPGARIKIVSNDLPSARKRLKAIRAQIAQNKRIQHVFPHLKPSPDEEEWTKESITIDRDVISIEPSVEAKAIRSIGTGGRADLLIYDDVCDFKNSIQNPTEREKVKKAFHDDWQNLLEPDGKAVYICTPWHQKDLTHELQKNKAWKFRADVIGPNFEPLWPKKWTRARLIDKHQSMPKSAYNRAYRGIAFSEETRIFDENVIKSSKRVLDPRDLPQMTHNWPKYTGMDLASGKKTAEAKHSVIFTAAVHKDNGVRIPLDIRRGQWGIIQIMQHLKDVHSRWGPEAIFVENNAVQALVVDTLKNIGCRGLPIKGVFTGKEKMQEDIGVPAMALDFENGLWQLPYPKEHKEECTCNLCLFVQECIMFPDWGSSDILMSAWLATRHLEKARLNLSVLESFEMEAVTAMRQESLITDFYSSTMDDDEERPFGAPYEEGW